MRKRKFKTEINSEGRVCTRCNVFKHWSNFPRHSRSKTGYASLCRQCKKENRPPRNFPKELNRAGTRRKELKESDPYLWKARNIRQALLGRKGADKSSTPSTEEIKNWLLANTPLTCCYSGEHLDIKELFHIDHKIPLSRGGTNCLNNLCLSTHKMNSAKGNLTEKEFKDLLLLISKWENPELLLRRMRQGYW